MSPSGRRVSRAMSAAVVGNGHDAVRILNQHSLAERKICGEAADRLRHELGHHVVHGLTSFAGPMRPNGVRS